MEIVLGKFHGWISIHAPHAGSDKPAGHCPSSRRDFNPRSPCGERLPHKTTLFIFNRNFNPRSPCGERPRKIYLHVTKRIFQSTLPMRGATAHGKTISAFAEISIHAPHAGSDAKSATRAAQRFDFNPRSPCGERRSTSGGSTVVTLFQSTLPMRGATRVFVYIIPGITISIHAPHAGSDSQTKNTESMRDSTYNFANLIKQVLWSTQNRY